MRRRDLFVTAMTSAGLSMATTLPTIAGDEIGPTPAIRIIDTNVSLFRWPFRSLPLDRRDALLDRLRSLGITQAWVGSYEGLLHRDIAAVNTRLADACQASELLVPVGEINPALPDWEADLRSCVDQYGMPAIRLHPNYHQYSLADRRFEQLLHRAAAANVLVQIAVTMEDPRTQHPLVQVDDVDLVPLGDVISRCEGARVQLLNARLSSSQLNKVADIDGLCADTARVEGTDGVASLVDALGPGRVLHGSGAPFLIPEAALIRVCESGLDTATTSQILGSNATTLSRPVRQ